MSTPELEVKDVISAIEVQEQPVNSELMHLEADENAGSPTTSPRHKTRVTTAKHDASTSSVEWHTCPIPLQYVQIHTCPIPLQYVQWTFECPLDISVRPIDEWAFEMSNGYFCLSNGYFCLSNGQMDICVCPMEIIDI